MNSSGTSTPPSNHIRKRRAHKRSRNGCMTCKQRHIRCDELKPVCTNCLTRGGDCGYPDAGGRSGSGSGPGGGGPTDIRTTSRAKQLRLLMFPTSPVDPFDTLPIKMPHRSMELFNHFANYRIFSRTPVPKSQDTACVGIVLGGPGVFRAGLLMTALHFSWMSPSGSLAHADMEETYLHHKLEAMRHVNELVADPQLCTSDDCIGLIAALAMAESGMGDIAAAEAHLKGLFTLVNMRRPEEWQHRFWGILQRIILVTGSFIAASKKPERGGYEQFMAAISDGNFDRPSPQSQSYPQPTGPVFSTAPFIATRLSPFYMGSTPDLEACKADAEGEVLINALRRLSSLTGTDDSAFVGSGPLSHSPSLRPSPSRTGSDQRLRGTKRHLSPLVSIAPQDSTFSSGQYGSTAGSAAGTGAYNSPTTDEEPDESPGPSASGFIRDVTAALLADTDAYIVSLLFKPHPLYPEAHKTTQVDGLDDNDPNNDHFTRTRPHPANPWVAAAGTTSIPSPQRYPYASLPGDQFPSSSRAWASAAYLYLYVVLEPLWFDLEDCCDESRGLYPGITVSAPVTPGSTASGRAPPPHNPISNPNAAASSLPQGHTEAGKGFSQKYQQPRSKSKGIDNPYFLRLLLDTLKADIQHTELGMRTGTYSKELWIWKVVIGAYTLAVIDENDVWIDSDGFQGTGGDKTDHTRWASPDLGGGKSPRICPEGARVTERMVVRLGNRSRPQPSSPPRPPPSQTQSPTGFAFGAYSSSRRQPNPQQPISQTTTQADISNPPSTSPYHSSSSSSPSPADSQSEDPRVHTSTSQPQPPIQITESERNYIPFLREFFTSRMRSWSRATRITSWQGARENIAKIAWPEHLYGAEAVARKLWEDGITAASTREHDEVRA